MSMRFDRLTLNHFAGIGALSMPLVFGGCEPQADFKVNTDNSIQTNERVAMEENAFNRVMRECSRIEDEYGPEPDLIDWGDRIPKEAYLFVTECALGRAGNGGVTELLPLFEHSWEFLVESFIFFEFHELAEVLRRIPEVHQNFTAIYGDQDVPVRVINEWFGELNMPFFDAVTEFQSETYEQIARIYFGEIEK